MSRGPSRVARLLVRLYPRQFRERFGPSMADAFQDRLDAARALSGPARWTNLLRAIGDIGVSAAKERLRPSYKPPLPRTASSRASRMSHLLHDLRFAIRSLSRRPGFAITALLTLSLGIGANTAVYSVVEAVLLRPLPYDSPEQLVMLWAHELDSPEMRGWMSLADINDARETRGIAALEGWQSTSLTYAAGDRPERIDATRVTGGFMDVFGVAPLAGRDLRREENATGTPRVAVLSYGFWQQRMNGREDAVGSTIQLSERSYEVVGIAPEGFGFPDEPELWIPTQAASA